MSCRWCRLTTIGITGIREFVISTTRFEELVRRWQNSLDPIVVIEPGDSHIGDGPAIRIVESDEDAVREIVLESRSAATEGVLASSRSTV